MINIFTAFAMVFIAEMGDKTQLFLIGLASKFKIRNIVIGVAAAIAVLNGAAVALGFALGGHIDTSVIKCAAGVAFLAFAYTSLFPKGGEEGTGGMKKGEIIAVFLSFLLAELGDKTQLMTLTLSAEARSDGGGVPDALLIFAGCSLGLFAADIIGMLAGYFLSKKLPEKAIGALSFAIFTFFGIYTLYEASYMLSGGDTAPVVITVTSATVLFAALCAVTLRLIGKKKTKTHGDKNEKRDPAHDESV